ncbi:hypothetical protein F4814DRAFT_420424 [Daldinia grandis]|nr:hypothetical protein F4814DRAFT_420424 [Daldinia grandis]
MVIGNAANWTIYFYDTRYFVPQWDEQLLGPAWKQRRGKWDFHNPPKPLPPTDPKMKDVFRYCETCQLTWLVGYSNLEHHQHPQHLAWEMAEEGDIDSNRRGLIMKASLIVYIHGESIPEDQTPKSHAGNSAGQGIFFGTDSQYNIAAPCGDKDTRYDAEGAELAAIHLSLTTVIQKVIRERFALLRGFVESNSGDTGGVEARLAELSMESTPGPSEQSLRDTSPSRKSEDAEDHNKTQKLFGNNNAFLYEADKLPFRTIFVLDNADVVDNICKHRKPWRKENGKLLTKQRKPFKNGDMYQKIEGHLCELEEEFGFTFKFYCVPKGHNKGATKLAKEALRGNFRGDAGRAMGPDEVSGWIR